MPCRSLRCTEQRIRLFAIPVDPAEMAKPYMLRAEIWRSSPASGSNRSG